MTDQPRDADAKVNDGVALFSQGKDIMIDNIAAWKMKSAYARD
jgi:hypothetical protein